jgi:predicted phosphoribosyltransferase
MSNSTHYFVNRKQAGLMIASRLFDKYRFEDTIVLALSAGAVLVGAEIAKSLHSLIAILMVKDIYLPDGKTIIGTINANGGFVYNNNFSAGEIEEFDSEYRGFIEESKRVAFHELNVALGQGGEINENYFRHRVVIVVSDGALNGTAFDMAYDYLKKIAIKKLVMVTPLASVQAIDRMHILADELICLNPVETVLEVNHYYNDNAMPTNQETVEILNNIIINWNQTKAN